VTTDAILPHNSDAEEAVLGCLLLDGHCRSEERMWPRVAALLKPVAFYSRRHAQMYAAMERLAGRGVGLDEITVAHELDRSGHLDEVGGQGYLSHLVAIIPTPLHAPYYAQIVRECWQRRDLIRRGAQMVQDGVTPPRNRGVRV